MLYLTSQHNISDDILCGDKSISHRALIFAAISDGKCVIHNISTCKDVLATAKCLRALGAQIDFCGNAAIVLPIKSPPSGVVTLDCENSGTTARLLAGLAAGMGVDAVFVGDKSLSARPMRRIVDPLMQMGANIQTGGGMLFRNIPARLHGAAIKADVPSAQVKSGVILAALFADGETIFDEILPTRNHTEVLAKQLGAHIQCANCSVRVAKSRISSFEMTVPNDPSSVAFAVALALLDGTSHTFCNICVNPRRAGFFRILKNAGADIAFAFRDETYLTANAPNRADCREDVADIIVKKSILKPLFAGEADVCDAIDEIPVLSALAIAVKGVHTFCGVEQLRFKECDRIHAIAKTAQACGQHAACDGKNLIIESNGTPLKRPHFDTFGDHRMAMSQAVLALSVCGGGSLDDENFDVSFPNFLDVLGVKPLRLGLVGQSVENSRSPKLMRGFAEQVNVCCSYVPMQLPPDVSDEQLLAAITKFDGANITMPFKTRVARLLGSDVPSVNTVGKNIAPTSTDGFGVVQALLSHGISLQNAPVWIIGAGGAAEACVAELKKYGCAMCVLNRTASHAKALTQKYGLQNEVDKPVGVLSFVPPCEFESQIVLPQSVRWVLNAYYKGQTGLQKQAISRGITYVGGEEMLFFQGTKSFALWTGSCLQNLMNKPQ